MFIIHCSQSAITFHTSVCSRCFQSSHLQESATHVRTIKAYRSNYHQLITQYNYHGVNSVCVFNRSMHDVIGLLEQLPENALTKQARGSLPCSNKKKTRKPTCATHVNQRTHTNTHRYTSLYTCAGTSKAYLLWASLARSPTTFQRCGRCLQSFHLQGSATQCTCTYNRGIAKQLSPIDYSIQQTRR